MCHSAVVSLSELDLPFKDTLDWTKFSVTVTRNEDLLQYIVKDKDNQQYTVKDMTIRPSPNCITIYSR